MSIFRFEELDVERQRNEILKAIHNRLSEISISLEFMMRYSSFIDGGELNEFQRDWTRYIERCRCLYIDENRKETQEKETQEGETD